MMDGSFAFLDPGRLVDGELELVLTNTSPAVPSIGFVPCYEFEMRRCGGTQVMGTVRLRIGTEHELRYPGHIGYEVESQYRGHRCAARSTRSLLPLAARHGLRAVWLTVDPKNAASRRTCDTLGAEYVETVRIPKEHRMYAEGARARRRYRLETGRIAATAKEEAAAHAATLPTYVIRASDVKGGYRRVAGLPGIPFGPTILGRGVNMPEQVRREMIEHMDQSLEVLKSNLAKVQTGRANPAMIEDVTVSYYEMPTPLKQLATIAAPDPNLLVVQPYDKTQMDEFVKGILGADLGLNPESDGNVIRVRVPKLSEERRKELTKVIKTRGEETKVALRNIRREANDLSLIHI